MENQPNGSNQPEKPAEEPTVLSVEATLEWHFPDEIKTVYANHLLAQVHGSEVWLSFFELNPPVILGPKDIERVKTEKSFRATCVARVMLIADRFPVFVKAMQETLDKHAKSSTPPEDS